MIEECALECGDILEITGFGCEEIQPVLVNGVCHSIL